MRALYLVAVLSVLSGRSAEPEPSGGPRDPQRPRQLDDEDSVTICGYEDDQLDTHANSYVKFVTRSFLTVVEEAGGNFVYSPYSAWLTMAAVVEGSENRKNLDDTLGLPLDWCVRKRYEKMILNTEKQTAGVAILRTRALVLDESLRLKKPWQDFVPDHLHQTLITAPINSDPVAAAYAIRQIINFQFQELNLSGNSVLLDSMDYAGLWKTAFPEVLKRRPFYDYGGNQTGWVDMMRVRTRVRMAFVDEAKAKVVELPVGVDGRYRMVFAQFVEGEDYDRLVGGMKANFIKNLRDSLQESSIPMEIQIPKFSLNTELNLRNIFEAMGVAGVWTEPSVTRHISEPPAFPSAYIQRTTVFVEPEGVRPQGGGPPEPAPVEDDSADTGLDPVLGRDFVADRPMLFGLFDSDNYNCLFVGSFATPTYSL